MVLTKAKNSGFQSKKAPQIENSLGVINCNPSYLEGQKPEDPKRAREVKARYFDRRNKCS